MPQRMVLVGLVASLGIFFWYQGVPTVATPAFNVAASAPQLAVKPPLPPPPGPMLRNGSWPLNMSADSFGVAFVPSNLDAAQILIEKNSHEALPIASLTKLITAAVSISQHPLETTVTITPGAIIENPDVVLLNPGDQFSLQELLRVMLVESSNNAAAALAQLEPPGRFIEFMNELAARWGLTTTSFTNPSGLDPEAPDGPVNHSSVSDLLRAAVYLLREEPQVLALSRQVVEPVSTVSGQFHHNIKPTNQLLLSSTWASQLVGGKTGQTDRAKKNLLVILAEPKLEGFIVAVILGSTDHFHDMDTLLHWVYQSYTF